MSIPQINCLLFDGFKSPSDVNIPNTKVAELADVMKNVFNNATVTRDNTILEGNDYIPQIMRWSPAAAVARPSTPIYQLSLSP